MGKIHVANLATRIPEAELVAVCDILPEELARVAGKFNIAVRFPEFTRMLERPDIEAVAICTPSNTHYQLVLEALAARKHVFCEKPLDPAIEKVEEMNAQARARGLHLMVGFNRRFDPNFAKVREIVKSGAIGEPHVVRITSRDPAPPPEQFIRASGGLFLDMTIHDFDMASYLAGSPVTEVYARATVLVDPVFERAGDWDTAVVTLTFANGAMGTIDNSRQAVYGYDQRVEVFGSKGMVTVGNNTPDNHILLDRVGVHSALPLNFFMERYTESYRREMQAFVEAVKANRPVPVTAYDSLMAVVIGLAAAKSVRENRPVKISELYDGGN
jgi:myo-inositol 2-dehydrogenase/D-chiro-inositol 1-dehydrogenase